MKKYIGILTITAFLGLMGCSQSPENTQNSASKMVPPENLTTVSIDVEGMTCTGCEQAIVKNLENKEGVQNAMASHTEGITEVTYDKSKISQEDLATAITETGYSVKSINP